MQKFCSFSATFKDNAAINCAIGQHKMGSFLTTLISYRSTTVVISIFNVGKFGDRTGGGRNWLRIVFVLGL
jgi:hypothetical protein